MSESDDRRYSIGEVSRMIGVAAHVLRQWEEHFSQLNPKRNSAGRRYYTASDINVARHINYLVRHKKMKLEGAAVELDRILYGAGRLEDRQAVLDLIDKIQDEVRAMLARLDSVR